MSEPPLVSVVIPTHNRANVLMRAIRSVLSQTYPNLEIIVVDDGSQDGTASILSGISGVRTIRQSNRGVSAARNAGISNSLGKLVAFLDSDDEWRPEKIQKQILLYSPEKPEFICHCNELWMRANRVVHQKGIHTKQGGVFFTRAVERCLISPSAVIISRVLLDKVGWFDEDLEAAEDYDLWLRITAFHEVDFVNEQLVIKHGGEENQLSVTTPAIDRFRVKALEKILDNPFLPDEYRDAARRELIRKAAILSKGFLKRGKLAEAKLYDEMATEHSIHINTPG